MIRPVAIDTALAEPEDAMSRKAGVTTTAAWSGLAKLDLLYHISADYLHE